MGDRVEQPRVDEFCCSKMEIEPELISSKRRRRDSNSGLHMLVTTDVEMNSGIIMDAFSYEDLLIYSLTSVDLQQNQGIVGLIKGVLRSDDLIGHTPPLSRFN